MISKKFKNIDRRELYKRIFEVLNYTQDDKENRLSKWEIEILVEFMVLPKKNTGINYIFSTGNKRRVMDSYNKIYGRKLDMTNLYKTLGTLRQKGLIVKDEDGLNYLSPYITNKIMTNDTFTINISFEDIKEVEHEG